MFKKISYLLFTLFIAGCASSPYTYHNQSVPLEKNATKYSLKDVTVNLTQGNGGTKSKSKFASQEELQKQFKSAIEKHLKEKNIFEESSNNSIDASINIDYKRIFTLGGKALSKPEVSHSVVVSKGDMKLASFGQSKYTTKYGYLKEAAVNFEIAAFKWGADDELKDVDLVSKLIVEDLSKLGK